MKKKRQRKKKEPIKKAVVNKRREIKRREHLERIAAKPASVTKMEVKGVPKYSHREFKMLCKRKKTSMTAAIIRMMQRAVMVDKRQRYKELKQHKRNNLI